MPKRLRSFDTLADQLLFEETSGGMYLDDVLDSANLPFEKLSLSDDSLSSSRLKHSAVAGDGVGASTSFFAASWLARQNK